MKRRNETPISVKQDGDYLKIRLPLEKPRRSKSGKTMLVASTYGVITTPVRYEGQNISVVASAFFYPKKNVSEE